MNILLEAEINWINKNIDLYHSALHAQSVIENIKKRYKINELERKIKELQLQRNR